MACTIETRDMHNRPRQCASCVLISANYGFLHYPLSATMGVFQNSACWHIAWSIENESDSGGEIWEEEDSFADIFDFLDPGGAAGCGIARLGIPERPLVITRSRRVAKTSYLIK